MAQGILPPGLATSIGTLPHADADAAVALVVSRQPDMPALPMLPNASPLERRIPQAAAGIRGVTVSQDGSVSLDLTKLDPEAGFDDPGFTHPAYKVFHRFLAALKGRDGYAKFQVTGPVTLGLALAAAGADTVDVFELAGEVVCQRATALLNLLAEVAPETRPVVFVDEPGVRSLFEPGFPIGAERAIDLVSNVLATVEPRAVTALRCGGPADWPLVLAAGPQVLAVPATSQLLEVAGTLEQFLERGGFVAWGAVPTDGPLGESVDRWWRQLSELWCSLVRSGVDPVKLRTQALVTPLSGLGRHSVSQCDMVLDLTNQLAQRLYDQATGLRLSVGA